MRERSQRTVDTIIVAERKGLIPQLSAQLKRQHYPLPLEIIILFGSYAVGSARVSSDIDLALVFGCEQILLPPPIEHTITQQIDHARKQFADHSNLPIELLHITTLTREYLNHPDEYAIARAVCQQGLIVS